MPLPTHGMNQQQLAAAQWGPGGIKAQAADRRIAQQQQAQQPQGGQNGFNISTGITPGPVYTQPQVGQAQHALRNQQAQMPQMPGRPFTPQAQSGMAGHLQSIVGQQGAADATDFGRQAAYANAQQQFAGDRARATAGTQWGGVLARDYATQLALQGQQQGSILGLLGALMG